MRKRINIFLPAIFISAGLMFATTLSMAAPGPGANKGGQVVPKGDAMGHPQKIRQAEQQQKAAKKLAKERERAEQQLRKQEAEPNGKTRRSEERIRNQNEEQQTIGQREGQPGSEAASTRERARDGAGPSSESATQKREREQLNAENAGNAQAKAGKQKGKKPWWKFWGDA